MRYRTFMQNIKILILDDDKKLSEAKIVYKCTLWTHIHYIYLYLKYIILRR